MAFLQEWLRLLTAFDTWAARTLRLAGFLFAAALAGAISVFGTATASVSDWHIEISLGWLALLCGGLLYAVATGGAAWVLSRGPRLVLSDVLIEDEQYEMFRLRITMISEGLAEPEAYLTAILDDGGSPVEFIRWGLELHWMDRGANERPQLSQTVPGTLDVVMVGTLSSVPTIFFCGMRDISLPVDGDVLWDEKRRIHFRITGRLVAGNLVRETSKWYAIEPAYDESPLHFRAVSSIFSH